MNNKGIENKISAKFSKGKVFFADILLTYLHDVQIQSLGTFFYKTEFFFYTSHRIYKFPLMIFFICTAKNIQI